MFKLNFKLFIFKRGIEPFQYQAGISRVPSNATESERQFKTSSTGDENGMPYINEANLT